MKPITPIRSEKEWETYNVAEEERQREALRKFYARETLRKVPMHVTGWQVFRWTLFGLVVLAALIYAMTGR